jgi:hypothetical protein
VARQLLTQRDARGLNDAYANLAAGHGNVTAFIMNSMAL